MSRKTRLSVNELDVVRTLRVAITGTVLGTSFVVGELGHATIFIHLREVESTVETAREVRNVDVKSEFLEGGVSPPLGEKRKLWPTWFRSYKAF